MKKIIWWIQLIVNDVFFLVLFFKLGSSFPLSFALSNILGIILFVAALVLGYALTVKFENDPDKKA